MHDGQQNPNDPTTPDDLYLGDVDSPDYDADLLDMQDMPAWPKVIGTLSIIFGSVSVLCGVVGIGALVAFNPMTMNAQMWEGATSPPPDQTADPLFWVGAGASVVANIILIVAGVMCAARNHVSRMAHLTYAAIFVVAVIVSTYAQVQYQAAFDKWLTENPDTQMAQFSNTQFNSIITIVFVSLYLIWPAFCVIWFGMVKRKPEDFTGGVEVVA
ncbi:MAG: DUF4064 domain-containing protein [Planctomycetota bacterium]